jgi:hypothetical protein
LWFFDDFKNTFALETPLNIIIIYGCKFKHRRNLVTLYS